MASNWIVRRGDKETPPITIEQLKEFAKSGKIRASDMIRREDQTDWQEAKTIKELLFTDGKAITPKPSAPTSKSLPTPPPTVTPTEAEESTEIVVSPLMKSVAVANAGYSVARRLVKKTLRTFRGQNYLVRAQTAPIVAGTVHPTVIDVRHEMTKPCPFCAESVLVEAKKCKHCGEIIDVTLRAAEEAKRAGEMSRYAAAQEMSRYVPPATPQQNVTQVVNVHVGGRKRWSPIVAMFLSLIIPGLGQMYKGQILNGLVWLVVVGVGYFMLVLPGLGLHLLCVIGAGLGDPYR